MTRIDSIELYTYTFSRLDLAADATENAVYTPGAVLERTGYVLRIGTDSGVVGEYAGGNPAEYAQLPALARYLLGTDALDRERIYSDIRRMLRQSARIGIGPIDIALWDLAGRYFGASIHRLLGRYRSTVPCYASTLHGSESAGLDSPEGYAEFAVRCRELGYPAFKIHGKTNDPDIGAEVATVLAVREAVGDEMDLMLDPACEYVTFAQALKVGRACDEANYFWYEDPYRDGGTSQFAHRKLRQLIRTPILQTEHVRSLEPHIDFALADATDFVRGDPDYDGITGVMKLAHACESIGLDIELHGPGPAQRQCIAAIRNTNYYELGLVHPQLSEPWSAPVYQGDYADTLEAVDERGQLPVPDGPGLGVEIDWDWVRQHQTDYRRWDP